LTIKPGKLIGVGWAFTAPGRGVGLLFWLFVAVFVGDSYSEAITMPALYICFLIGAYFLFSKKYLEIIDAEKGIFKIRIGIGKFSHGKEKSLENYKYAILQQGTWIKKVAQGIAGASITEGIYKEKYLGLFIVSKKDNMKSLLYRGIKSDIYEIIRHFMSPCNFPVYNGAKRKGTELKL